MNKTFKLVILISFTISLALVILIAKTDDNVITSLETPKQVSHVLTEEQAKERSEIIWRLHEAIYYECRSLTCSNLEQQMIVTVIINRSNHWRFNYDRSRSIIDVIEQDKQFSYLNEVKTKQLEVLPQNSQDKTAQVRALNVAQTTYRSYLNTATTISDAMYYYNPDKVTKKPLWVNDSCLVNTGNTLHRFYSCAL